MRIKHYTKIANRSIRSSLKINMADGPGIGLHEKLSDLIECSICVKVFTNPKILPCVHTFCLSCLENYGKYHSPGHQMSCPLCRNSFTIPDKGFSDLPNNFFIGKIVEIVKLAAITPKETICDLCMEETAIAQKFCIDCEQKICDRCSTLHGRMKHCQSHQVVTLGSELDVKKLHFCNSYCEHHPKEVIKMFCHEDNVTICLICCVESHQSHRCSNVDKAAGKFTEQLNGDLRKVAKRHPECDEAFEKLDNFKKEFSDEILKTEESIRKSGADIKALIDKQIEELVQKLKVVRDRNLKDFEFTKQNVERFKVMIDSYQRYCNELLARGSPVDICRAANQMHTRAVELNKLSANFSPYDFNCDKTAFLCANMEILHKHCKDNVVGELKVTKSLDWIVEFQKRISDYEFAANWEMTTSDKLKVVELGAGDQEYKDVAKAVMSTALTTVNQIVKIERIQNKTLYKQYVARSTTMDTANPEVQNEMTLWHGTTADTVESINQTGFNQSNCGKSGDVGTGVYFSKNFSYAAQNVYRSLYGSGLKHVYQCRVLTGEYALGNRRATSPPSKPGKMGLRYDSAVDNVAQPTIFVTYCSSQAYPEYLIHFK